MTVKEANDFLKTREGLKYLLHITDEYGTWDESKQAYDMPVDEAISIAIAELTCND